MVFILPALWWTRIRSLWKLCDGRDWLWGKLGLVLMDRAMLCKSLMQFSVDGWTMFPPCCLTWDQTMVELMKIISTSFKRSPVCTPILSAPDPAVGHHWPMLPPETPGHSLTGKSGSVSCRVTDPFSWALMHTIFCLCPPSVFPQPCVSSGGSMVGLMTTSSKRACTTPRSAASRALAPVAGHCWPVPPQETLKHSKAGLTQSLWGLLVHSRLCLSSLSVSGGYGIWF